MSKNILLTGPPGCGKTTIIRQVVAMYPGKAGGFYTRETRQEGKRTGFEIVTLGGRTAPLANVNFPKIFRVGKYGVDLQGLEEVGIPTLTRAMRDNCLVVIDEIGPMELFSHLFREAVTKALDGPCKVLGTIYLKNLPFTDEIKARPDVQIVEVRPDMREELLPQLLEQLSE